MPDKFPTDQWIEAVRWHGDTKIAAIVHNEAEWADAKTLLATLENVVVEPESKQEAVVSGRRMRRWRGTCVRCGWLFFFCQCRARLKPRRSSILLFRLSIPTYENISETDT